MATSDLASMIEPVARELLGEPNAKLSSAKELRWGTRGSFSVRLDKGVFFDNESQTGGGTLDLIERATGLHGEERWEWLRRHGYIDGHASAAPTGNAGHPKPNGKAGEPHGKLVGTFPYTDEVGRLSFEVLKYDPKDFRQRRPDGNGGWIWSTKGVKPILYRLPDVVEAVAQERTILIVEGERDVDNLWAIGIPATCNAGGAGKWHDALNEVLAGADIVIIPDNDPQKKHPKTGEPMFHADGRPIIPGRDHAHQICAALEDVAARVRFLDLAVAWPTMPSKGDTSDWLKAGGTAEALYALIDEAPEWSTELRDRDKPRLSAKVYVYPDPEDIPRRSWLYGWHYMRKAVTATVAPGGFGKTTLALYEMMRMLDLGYRVWYISGEDDQVELDRRIAAHVQVHGKKSTGLFVDDKMSFPLKIARTTRNGAEFDEERLAAFEAAIAYDRIDVVILDPFVSFHVLNESDTGSMDMLVKRLAEICTRQNCSIELSHHVRKPSFGQAEITVYDARGAAAIVNAVRSCRVLNQMSTLEAEQANIPTDKRSRYIRIDPGKRNMAPAEKAKWCQLVSVDIANGDNVQAIDKWSFQTVKASEDDRDWIRDLLRGEQRYRADSRSPDWLGRPVAEHFGRDLTIKGHVMWVAGILKRWVSEGVIAKEEAMDENRKMRTFYVLPKETSASEPSNVVQFPNDDAADSDDLD